MAEADVISEEAQTNTLDVLARASERFDWRYRAIVQPVQMRSVQVILDNVGPIHPDQKESAVNESALSELRREVADALTFTSTQRATDLTFAMASGKVDVDPDVEIVVRRVSMEIR